MNNILEFSINNYSDNKLKANWKLVTDNLDTYYINSIVEYAKTNGIDVDNFKKSISDNLLNEISNLMRYGCNPFIIRNIEYKLHLLKSVY